jgi:hypothetical protein
MRQRSTPKSSPMLPIADRVIRAASDDARVRVLVLMAAPLAFVLIPTRHIEKAPILCPFRRLTGHNCPGCGMTRAVSCLMHGRPRRAVAYNPRVLIVFPLMVWLWLTEMRSAWTALLSADSQTPVVPS